jgi:Uma2 family endonuclease
MRGQPVKGVERRKPGPPRESARLVPSTDEEGQVIRVPVSACTLAGFRVWSNSDTFPESGRISFLGDEIFIDMTHERLESHVKVKFEVTRVPGNLVVEHDLGTFYADGTRIVNEAAELSNEPDAAFVSWASREAGLVRPVPSTTGDGDFTELEGTPDWVLEIVSPSSVGKDTERLRERYHRAGIPEYWLIDARGEEIDFQILEWRATGYVAARRRGGWQKSRVFGRSFRLVRQRDRVDEWQYRLEVKPSR